MHKSKSYISLLFLLLFVAISANAQRLKVGLVLSGGGAKGLAHVGVIKVLEEADIPIDYIAGTSMGAVVGGLYSIGYTAHQLDSLVHTQDWTNLLSDNISRQDRLLADRENSDKYQLSIPLADGHKFRLPTGIVQGQAVYNLLTSLTIGYHDSISFNTLPIPFACISYDLVKGQEIVFRSGMLPQAIRASMSIPGAFMPVKIHDQLLIDGGIANNLPIDVVKKMGADVIIAIDVTEGMYESNEIKSMFEVVNQLTTIIGNQKYKQNIPLADIYMHPQTKPYTITSFNKEAIDTLTARGEVIARHNMSKLMNLRSKIGLSPDSVYTRHRKNATLVIDSLTIGRIFIEGLNANDRNKVNSLIKLKEKSQISVYDLKEQIGSLRSSGLFSSVSYKLHKNQGNDLTIFLTQANKNALNFGLRYDTEEDAAIFIGTTIASNALKGSELDITGKLGTSSFAKIGYKASNNRLLQNFGLSYMYKYNDNDIYLDGKKVVSADYQQHLVDLSLSGFYINKFKLKIGTQYEYLDYGTLLVSNNSQSFTLKSSDYISHYAQLKFENLDDLEFPTKGAYILGSYMVTTDNGYKLKDKFPMQAFAIDATKAISLSPRVALIPTIYGRVLLGDDLPYPYKNLIGGAVAGRYRPQQIPFIGVNYCEPTNDALVVGRMDFRVRLWKNHFISAKGNYLLSSTDISDLLEGEDILGGGIEYAYNTILGPISIGFNSSTLTKKLGIYFSLFRYF